MGREKPAFPIEQSLCHNAKVVHAFESNTPFEKLPGTQINVPLSIAPAAPPVPHFPRFRALALFGRRSPQCVDSLVMPASENLHNNELLRRNEGKRPDSGLLGSTEQNWTSIIWERGHTGIMASERKVLARQEFSCTSRAR